MRWECRRQELLPGAAWRPLTNFTSQARRAVIAWLPAGVDEKAVFSSHRPCSREGFGEPPVTIAALRIKACWSDMLAPAMSQLGVNFVTDEGDPCLARPECERFHIRTIEHAAVGLLGVFTNKMRGSAPSLRAGSWPAQGPGESGDDDRPARSARRSRADRPAVPSAHS